MKYIPTEAELSDNLFEQSPSNKLKHMWYRTIKPYNPKPCSIIYNSRYNKWRYSSFHYNIRSEEDIKSIVKILSK